MTNKMVVDLIAGTRPNFVKLSPLYDIFSGIDIFEPRFIYTGQHSDPLMSSFLFDILDLPEPYMTLGINKKFGLDYLSDMIKSYNNFVNIDKPDLIVVVGCSDSTLAGALVANRNSILLTHIEAGMRVFDSSVEENNRRCIDSLSDLLLTPIEQAQQNLINEKCYGNKNLVGNVMIDSLVKIQPHLKKVDELDIIITLHRPENVNRSNILIPFIDKLDKLDKEFKIIFPVHPRTKSKLKKFNIKKRDYMIEPLLYDKFLSHIKSSKLVVTDSGGVQAESSFFSKNCLLMSETTCWKNLVDKNVIITNINSIEENVYENMDIKSDEVFDFGWDGTASINIINSLYDFIVG